VAAASGDGEDAGPAYAGGDRCGVVGGELDVSDESSEAGWFTLEEFPEPAFEGERQALALLRSRA
jgi:hypothetical protein